MRTEASEKLVNKISDQMYKSPIKALHVIADLNSLFSAPLSDLMKGYRERQDAAADEEAEPPTPADFMLGFTLFFLSQYENISQNTLRPGHGETAKQKMHEIIEIGASRVLGQLMQDGGVTTDDIKADIAEYFKEKTK